MKHFPLIIFCAFILVNIKAQSPQGIPYQSVIRNSSGALLTNLPVSIRFSIHDSTVQGAIAYQETHNTTTSNGGMVTLTIGQGTPVTGSFSAINWGVNSKFMQVELDTTGGSSYIDLGTQQMMSVPYALYSSSAPGPVSLSGDTLKIGGNNIVIPGINLANGGKVYCTGSPTQVVDVVSSYTGKTWMDRNLGATQVATSPYDGYAFGDLYQWGRGNDGHQCRQSNTTTTQSSAPSPGHGNFIVYYIANSHNWLNPYNQNLWQGVNGVNNPCPNGYRLPTEAEFTAELQWLGSNNGGNYAFASPLKLSLTGGRGGNGILWGEGVSGYYWTSTHNSWMTTRLFFGIGPYSSSGFQQDDMYTGLAVRCIKN